MAAIKLIRLTSGEEIIGEVDDPNGDVVTIFDAIILIPAGEGKIGFMKFMPYTKANEGIPLPRRIIMFIVDPIEDLLIQFKSHRSGLSLPKLTKIIS
jgi:hypothetical protein